MVHHYLEGTTTSVAPDETGEARYGEVISVYAANPADYTVVGDTPKPLSIRIEDQTDESGNLVATNNVIIFYYKEKSVTINYKMVGPDGAVSESASEVYGSISVTSESVKAVTGTVGGSTAAADSNNTYRFVGWYSDPDCNTQVSTNATYVPGKSNATYYAKFEYNLADLTITKSVTGTSDKDTFIFHITGPGVDTKVTITGNGSVTLKGLTVGTEYTIKEDTVWSWRYQCDSEKKVTIQAGGSAVTFTNKYLDDAKWLTDSCTVENTWTKTDINDKKKSSRRKSGKGEED